MTQGKPFKLQSHTNNHNHHSHNHNAHTSRHHRPLDVPFAERGRRQSHAGDVVPSPSARGGYVPYEDEADEEDADVSEQEPPSPPVVVEGCTGGPQRPVQVTRGQSWSDVDATDDKSTAQSDRPGSGLMLRKVPSFSALRSQSPATAARSALGVRHNPLPAATHHSASPHLHNGSHQSHHVSPAPLPQSIQQVLSLAPTPPPSRTSALSADTARRLSKFKSGDSLKSFIGVLPDGDRDRELVVETDDALQSIGRPPLFKSATLPCRTSSSKGKGDDDLEEFVWSGSPDPHQSRNRRSFSSHLLPAPTEAPSAIIPVSASGAQRLDMASSDYHTPPSASRGHSDILDTIRAKAGGPKLKRSSEFRNPPRRSGQPAAPYLPVLHSQYGGGMYADESSPERSSHAYAGGTSSGGEQSSGFLHEYSLRGSFEEERAYLLRAKRRESRPRGSVGDSDDISERSIPKPRSLILLVGTIFVLLLGTFTLFTFCIQPLSQLSVLGIGDVRGTYDLFEFDVVFAAANENVVPVYVRNVDLDIFVSSDLMIDQNTSSNLTGGRGGGGNSGSGKHASKELLAHVRHLTTAIAFPALTPSTQTTPTGHISIRDPENTLGKLIYLNYPFPYTLTVRGNVRYRTLWYVEYVVKVSCVVPVEHAPAEEGGGDGIGRRGVVECVNAG
ncbi:hypothetical protein BDZ88DRAFT_401878 [Geranomyces variabilis]|nr:hypothetical protein BDZ88DRAFT_401878 [Geranomyces variabilis]